MEPYNIAGMYAGLGENDRYFEWVQKAYEEHSPSMVYLKIDPFIERIREDPRYAEFLRRMSFP